MPTVTQTHHTRKHHEVAARISPQTLDGISLGLGVGTDVLGESIGWMSRSGFQPFAGKTFDPVVVTIDGEQYRAYVAKESTMIGNPAVASADQGDQVVLQRMSDSQFSTPIPILRDAPVSIDMPTPPRHDSSVSIDDPIAPRHVSTFRIDD